MAYQLYTSDAADESFRVDASGRRNIKKKNGRNRVRVTLSKSPNLLANVQLLF